MKILGSTLTPIAFADPPLLNVMGVHEPYALRSVLQVQCEDGIVGLGESYGDAPFLEQVARALPALIGLDAFDLPAIRAAVSRALGRAVVTDAHGLIGGFSADKTLASVYSMIEVAALDAQGKALHTPVVELLGGRARDRVDFSAYLFYKYAAHADGRTDPWGAALDADGLVEQARRMIDVYGFGSIKVKGGVFAPEVECEGIEALAAAFPGRPLRLDPNAGWTPATSINVASRLEGVLEYLEDPTPGQDGMAQVAAHAPMPLATNMCVVSFADIPQAVRQNSVQVILSDHHFWGGLRDTLALGTLTETFGLGLSMHSNSHLGISLAAMVHVAAATRQLTYACDTHWPWKDTDIVEPGVLEFRNGSVAVPTAPGLGVSLDLDALARAHETYQSCGQTRRDDVTYMRRFVPDFTPNTARW
ncbi:enolase C-terminal domain-like protein [Rudaeicoccus suwonensis]|uniref:glucarate dehydratase n=1 Tax=Rudaeicoccus suwonensis TaxID=657409 RepID=A0A561EC79_9MICO|nr:enolase C-terminal domain-like protein [Rudaeicoccus suwonensis]TWE13214.1 glucarate dehydratase [Rudaeicoccus suwonensis]